MADEAKKDKIKPTSYWSWSLWNRCPKSYDLTILQRKREEFIITHERTVLGSLVHNAMELGLSKDLWLQWDLALHRAAAGLHARADAREIKRQFKKAKVCLEWVVKNVTPHLKEENKFHSEVTFKAPYSPAGMMLSGRVDLVIEGPDFCCIYDYKGVKRRESLTHEQMWFYSKGTEEMFHKPLREAAYLWFTERYILPIKPETIEDRMRDSLLDMKSKVLSRDLPARINRLCSYCDVRNHCTEYQELINGERNKPKPDA